MIIQDHPQKQAAIWATHWQLPVLQLSEGFCAHYSHDASKPYTQDASASQVPESYD
jgi:hypothetical protein